MQRGLKLAWLSAAALLIMAAAPSGLGWTSQISLTAEGQHLIGNPKADVVLTEYVTYACRACLRFNVESDAVLMLAYIPSGRLAIEVQPLAGDSVEMALAMLATCGPPGRFVLTHNALLRSQSKWLPLVDHATASQQQRWNNSDLGTRNRAIAGDLGLYDVMASRGVSRLEVDRCLASPELAARVTATTAAARAAGVANTPGFAIDGELLENTTTWAKLRPQLDESLK